MARGNVQLLTLKKFIGTEKSDDLSIIDNYEDKGSILVEIYEADNSYGISSTDYYEDVRRSYKGYIGVIRRFKLPEGRYILESGNISYMVDKAHTVGNRTFLKLSLMEGY